MWRDDDDWRDLTVDAQWLYMALVSQSDLTLAGVLHVSRRRWSKFAADLTADRLDTAIFVLSDRRFIVVDEDTEELLIRSFARRETQWNNNKRVGGLKSAAGMIQSAVILSALMAELARVGRNADGSVSVNRSGNQAPIEVQSVERKNGDIFGQSTTNPEPIPVNANSDVSRLPSLRDVDVESSTTSSSGDKSPRGTRFNRGLVTDAWSAYAESVGFTRSKSSRILDDFADYWTAKAGKDATKVDWLATWRGWVRREADRNPPTASSVWSAS